VEKGVAPDDSLVATKFDNARNVLFTRPLCAYPNFYKYHNGDPNDAQSYQCKKNN
jgi:Tannase and feruloyl esterase